MSSKLEEEFALYEEALTLKELGFDEPCFGYFSFGDEIIKQITEKQPVSESCCLAPTYSQTFNFFREKYNLGYKITSLSINCHIYEINLLEETSHRYKCWSSILDEHTKSYKETKLACLKKLIEISKK